MSTQPCTLHPLIPRCGFSEEVDLPLHVTPLSFLWASAPWSSSDTGMALPTCQGFQAVPMPLRRMAPTKRNANHKEVLDTLWGQLHGRALSCTHKLWLHSQYTQKEKKENGGLQDLVNKTLGDPDGSDSKSVG